MTDIEVHEAEVIEPERFTPAKSLGGIPHLDQYLVVAERISRTELVPQAFRGKPDSILAAVLYGAELGLGPLQSLSSINMIQGRPSLSAEAMRALVLQSGHQIRIDATNIEATAKCHRKEWDGWESVTFTMDDAKRAGLRGDNWTKYPRAMLSARVTSEACRLYFADVIAGLSYVPEEIESFDPPPTVSPMSPVATVRREPPVLDVPPPANDDGEVMMSPDQAKKIFAMLRDAGIPDTPREVRLEYITAVLKREVESTKTLTGDEAHRLIEALQVEIDGGPPPPPEADEPSF